MARPAGKRLYCGPTFETIENRTRHTADFRRRHRLYLLLCLPSAGHGDSPLTLDGVRGWCDTGAEPSGGGACRPVARVPDTSIVPSADGFQPLVSGEAGLLVPETGLPEPSRVRPEAGGLSYSVGAPRPQPQATMRPNGQLRTAHGVRGAAVRRRHHGAQLAGFDRAPQAAVNYLLDAALAAHHGPAFQNLLLKTGEGSDALASGCDPGKVSISSTAWRERRAKRATAWRRSRNGTTRLSVPSSSFARRHDRVRSAVGRVVIRLFRDDFHA